MKIQRYEGVKGYDDRTLHLGGYSEKKQTYRNVKLFLIALVSLCILAALETTVCARIPLPLLDSGSPSLCLIFILASGYLLGEKEGCVCGLLGGIISECMDMEPLFGGIMILPLVYCVLGYLSGALSGRFLGGNLPSFLIYVLMGKAVELLITIILFVRPIQLSALMAFFLRGALPELILTLIFAPFIYGLKILLIKSSFK